MDCTHEWRRSPFNITFKRTHLPNGRTEMAEVSFELCTHCGSFRIDPQDVRRLTPL